MKVSCKAPSVGTVLFDQYFNLSLQINIQKKTISEFHICGPTLVYIKIYIFIDAYIYVLSSENAFLHLLSTLLLCVLTTLTCFHCSEQLLALVLFNMLLIL